MKFSNDKKSSIFTYANDIIIGAQDKMEISLEKELEATKSALKMQTMRCRHLVVAFTRKLHEKEMELRASKDLRDQQLSLLLRALIILESRLKKEQKVIRRQLEEKDLIIEKQEKEISKYKRSETNRKWPKLDSMNGNKEDGQGGEIPLATGEERLDNLCKGLLHPPLQYLQNAKSDSGNLASDCNPRNTESVKREENTYIDNPVLESVNQILLRDEEELLKTPKPISLNLTEKVLSDNVGETNEWYDTNSNAVPDEEIMPGAWSLNLGEDEEIVPRKEIWSADKTSPIKSQHLEEKACLEMAKKNLTVVDLEEIDSKTQLTEPRAVSPVKSTASYEEIVPVAKNSNYKPVQKPQKPPALPPKPARLLKPHQIFQKRNNSNKASQQKQQDQGEQHPPGGPSQPTSDNHGTTTTGSHSGSGKATSPGKKPVLGKLSQLSGGTRHCHGDAKATTKSSGDGIKTGPRPADFSSKSMKGIIGSLVSCSLDVSSPIAQSFGKAKKTDDVVGAIKMGTSVSSLITGSSGDTIVTELSGDPVPDDSHVSQLVRQFEVLGKYTGNRSESDANDIRKNFEEFKLEESYVESDESGRLDGDGAENKNMVNYYATLTIVPPPLPKDPPPETGILDYKMYETFLENTGLSQKSILTPSRMLSNHRSCLKPKDVKHRNRVKAAAAIEKCNLNGGSTVKYWTEPFL